MPSVEMHALGLPHAASLMLQQSLKVDCSLRCWRWLTGVAGNRGDYSTCEVKT